MKNNLGAITIDQIRLDFIKSVFKDVRQQDKLLDLGCGIKPFYEIYAPKFKTSIGIEVKTSVHDQSKVDVFYDGINLPFNDKEFDVVLSTEVMEHVPNPEKYLSEIHRVLKNDGIAIITIPFFVPLHEQPHDYYRYTEFALRHLAQRSSFEIVRLEVFGDYFSVLISLLITPHLKIWNIVAKKLQMPFIYSFKNPVIYLFVYLPQLTYLGLRNINCCKKLFRKMNYFPKGYGIVIKKKEQ